MASSNPPGDPSSITGAITLHQPDAPSNVAVVHTTDGFAPGVPVLLSQPTEGQQMLSDFWANVLKDVNALSTGDWKDTQDLPLARIKKIMKLDGDVKMISAEAPIIFAKAAEIFIAELTLRSWIHTEELKRRTLQRSDVAMAISKYDQFDFLIDIVPRDELKPQKQETRTAEPVKYFYQLGGGAAAPAPSGRVESSAGIPAQANPNIVTVQQPQQQPPQVIHIQQPSGIVTGTPTTPEQKQQTQTQTVQLQGQGTSSGVQGATIQLQLAQTPQQSVQYQTQNVVQPPTHQPSQTAQVIQLQQSPSQQSQSQNQQTKGMQVFQQVIGPNGEVKSIPLQLTPEQLQQLQQQAASRTPVVVQTVSSREDSSSTAASSQQPIQQIYDDKELQQGKLDMLVETNMVDFALEVHKYLNGDDDPPEFLITKRENVVKQFTELKEKVAPFFSILQNAELATFINTRDRSLVLSKLENEYQFNVEMLDVVYDYAKFCFDCGNYSSAAELLPVFRMLVGSPNDKRALSALWGTLACQILVQNWNAALEELQKLRETIDTQMFGSALGVLQQRAWVIHWSLFVYFHHPKGCELLIDTFLNQKQYLNTIQTLCPHMLRYLATAVVICKKRSAFKDLIEVVQQEAYKYRDPITEFIECLYVKFDFDRAQNILRDCETVLENDFFLVACKNDFIENARIFLLETFCRIHQCISINMLSEKLNMSEAETELWIVNMIRSNDRLDAKIDSQLGHVVMGTKATSPYELVMKKTMGLSFRSQTLTMTVDRKLQQKIEQQQQSQMRHPNYPEWGPPLTNF